MARVCLSFDNGPDPEGTPRVLDVLGRRGLRSTFFALGRRLAAPEGRALAETIVAAGHRLGHHTYSHETPLGDDERPDLVERELEATHRLLEELRGAGPRLFRPFGGGGRIGPHLLRSDVLTWLQRQRYTVVLWDAVPGDFRDPEGWVDRGLQACDEAQDDLLVVLHDAAPQAMTRLESFLDALEARGHVLDERFPERCLPIVDGEPRLPLEPLVTPHPS